MHPAEPGGGRSRAAGDAEPQYVRPNYLSGPEDA